MSIKPLITVFCLNFFKFVSIIILEMINMEKNKIEKFIHFVVDLVQEDDIFLEGGSASYYFTHGGCYELFKVVNHYIPETVCMINKELDHCAIGYKDNIYDALGIIKNRGEFSIATKEDIEYMERSFGLGIKTLESNNIINEVEECNIKGILY